MVIFTDLREFVVETCCVCGCDFGMPASLRQKRLEDGKLFYCPNGHSQHYSEPLEKQLKEANKKLQAESKQRQLTEKWYKAEQDDHAHTRRRLSASKGQLTKTRKRIANGVCPCCNRHFVNLHRHMQSQHPDYTAEGEE